MRGAAVRSDEKGGSKYRRRPIPRAENRLAVIGEPGLSIYMFLERECPVFVKTNRCEITNEAGACEGAPKEQAAARA